MLIEILSHYTTDGLLTFDDITGYGFKLRARDATGGVELVFGLEEVKELCAAVEAIKIVCPPD